MPMPPSRIIWSALTMSQVMLIAVVFLFSQQLGAGSGKGIDVSVETLAGVAPFLAAGLLLASVIVSKFGGVDLKASRPAVDRKLEKDRPLMINARALGILIVRGALHEAIVILGFVLAFTMREPTQILPYFVVGFVANLLIFPRDS
jgi:hypothetical protein